MAKATLEYPTQSELHDLYRYEDGNLFRRHTSKGATTTKPVGWLHKSGYRRLTSKGRGKPSRTYTVHRLIYIYHHGDVSNDLVIDHINHDRSDNRVENLRAVTEQQNIFHKARDSKPQYYDGHYHVRVGWKYSKIYGGRYKTKYAAEYANFVLRQQINDNNPEVCHCQS